MATIWKNQNRCTWLLPPEKGAKTTKGLVFLDHRRPSALFSPCLGGGCGFSSPDKNEALYRRIHDALEPGGRIVVRDYVMSSDHTAPPEGAMFAVNMLAQTRGGSTYTYEEIAAGLAAAGFHRIRLIRSQGMFSLVEGFRKD